MTTEIRFYYSEATRVNQPKQDNQYSMSCCSIERKELYNTNIIKFISENVSTVIERCFNEVLSIELEPIFMKNLENYDHHHGYRLIIDTEFSDDKIKRFWNILILFFHQVLVIRSPENYIPASIINIDFNKNDKEVIEKYIPVIFNKKLGKPLSHPVKIELVGHNEILEVVNKWGENQDASQPVKDGKITFKGRFNKILFNNTFIITTSEFGDIKIINEEYQNYEILDLAKKYNGDIHTHRKNKNLIKVTVEKWYNPLNNKSEYIYLSAEIISVNSDKDRKTLQLNLESDFD